MADLPNDRDNVTPLGRSVGESLATGRYLLLVAAPLGALVGAAIAAYDYVVNELFWAHVTARPLAFQIASPVLGLFLAGVILRFFRIHSSAMADEVVKAYHDPDGGMPTDTAIGKLTASIATMGLGGSAGMEGASKWLGATIGSLVQKILNRLRLPALRWDLRTTLLTGGSAGIAAIFRAPLSGAIMGVESPYKRDLAHDALVPALVASATSFWVFAQLRPSSPYFPVHFHYVLSSRDVLIAFPLGLSAGLASHVFLWFLGRCRNWFGALPVSLPLRTGLGGLCLAALALIAYAVVGKPATLQAGLPVANELLNGKYLLPACLALFVLKLMATSITFGSGGVGGLFVPTATIGAALGACWDQIVPGSVPGIYTLLGIAAFSGASYNSLLFSAVFIAEATGNVFLVVPALIASTFAFLVAAGVSNSRAQRTHRGGLQETLAHTPVSRLMTTRIITTTPGETLDAFAKSVLVAHHFKALPVIDDHGVFQGMVGLPHLRGVPMTEWRQVLVAHVMDSRARTVCPHHSAAEADQAIRQGPYDYVPVVDPTTYQLIGMISRSDIFGTSSTSHPAAAAA